MLVNLDDSPTAASQNIICLHPLHVLSDTAMYIFPSDEADQAIKWPFDHDDLVVEGCLWMGGVQRRCWCFDLKTGLPPSLLPPHLVGNVALVSSGDWVSCTRSTMRLLGRCDDVMKIHGQRVHMGDVESFIRQSLPVTDCR